MNHPNTQSNFLLKKSRSANIKNPLKLGQKSLQKDHQKLAKRPDFFEVMAHFLHTLDFLLLNTKISRRKSNRFSIEEIINFASKPSEDERTSEFIKISSKNKISKIDFSKLKKSIKNPKKNLFKPLLENFKTMSELPKEVYIFSITLLQRAISCLKEEEFEDGELLILYNGCLHLSIKSLIDTERWFLEDFSDVSGLSKGLVQKTELLLFCEVLNGKVGFDIARFKEVEFGLEELEFRIYEERKKRILGEGKKRRFVIKRIGGLSFRGKEAENCESGLGLGSKRRNKVYSSFREIDGTNAAKFFSTEF